MTITFDGERSKARVWFIKKLVNLARQMNLLSLKRVWDGFTFSVTNIDPNIEIGKVTAPEGLVVACVSPGKVSVGTSDYWLNPVSPLRQINRFNGATYARQLTSYIKKFRNTQNSPLIPDIVRTWFKSPIPYDNSPAKVQLSPLSGEWYSFAHTMACVDISCTVGHEAFFYLATGTQSKRFGIFDLTNTGIPFFSSQRLPTRMGRSTYVYTSINYLWWHSAPSERLICFYKSEFGKIGESFHVNYRYYYGDELFRNLPLQLVNHLVTRIPNYLRFLGAYAFSTDKDKKPTLLLAVDATHWYYSSVYFTDNPSQIQWKCFFCILDEENGTLASFGAEPFVRDFYDFNIYDNDGIKWDRVVYGVSQWFAWPNRNRQVPYDSAMFHDHNGNVITWTRRFGTVRINASEGAVRTSIQVPPAASQIGVRPEIYLAEGSLYWCRCVQEKWGVRGLYYGSPYTGWTEIPNTTGYRMVEARLVKLQAEPLKCVFIGVFWDGENYYTGVFDGGSGSGSDTNKWKITGKIKGVNSTPDVTTWSMSLYGDGVLVESMQSAPASPPSTPQFAVCDDYSEYEAMIP